MGEATGPYPAVPTAPVFTEATVIKYYCGPFIKFCLNCNFEDYKCYSRIEIACFLATVLSLHIHNECFVNAMPLAITYHKTHKMTILVPPVGTPRFFCRGEIASSTKRVMTSLRRESFFWNSRNLCLNVAMFNFVLIMFVETILNRMITNRQSHSTISSGQYPSFADNQPNLSATKQLYNGMDKSFKTKCKRSRMLQNVNPRQSEGNTFASSEQL